MTRDSCLVDFIQSLSDGKIVSTLQGFGLLPLEKACGICLEGLCRVQGYAQATDKQVFRCNKCRVRHSLRQGTVFGNSNLSLSTLMVLVFGFVTGMIHL